MQVPIEVSARHVHLSTEDCEKLFGGVCLFHHKKELSQHGQYAEKETVDLVSGDRIIEHVRVLGPPRDKTQVEIAFSDAFHLHLRDVPLRLSGDLEGSSGITLRSPKGEIELKEGIIIAKRHMHISTAQADKQGLKNEQIIRIKIPGERGTIFDNVIVRVRDDFELAVHLDTDEANAAGVVPGTLGEIIANET